MTRDDVVREARRWHRTPWRERGRNRNGLDCLGLGVVVADAFEVSYQDFPDYSAWPDPSRRILSELQRWLKPMPSDLNLKGCIGVFMQVGYPGHIGIFTEKHGLAHVIHARIRHGVVEEPWQPHPMSNDSMRLIALFAFPALEV